MNFLKTICCALLLYAGSSVHADLQVTSGAISVVDSVMRITGDITPKLALEFRASLSPDIRTIVITSRGGHTGAGLDMAELIFGKDITVIAEGQCASSCANLFIAASRKIIQKDAYVGWHGGPVNGLSQITYGVERALAGEADKLVVLEEAQLLNRAISFYKRTGVDINFIYYAGMVGPLLENKQAKPQNIVIDGKVAGTIRYTSLRYGMWAPDSREMQAAGIQNVAPFAYPKDKRKLKEIFGDANAYLGKAYTYIEPRMRKAKYPMRFEWEKYHTLQEKIVLLSTLVERESLPVTNDQTSGPAGRVSCTTAVQSDACSSGLQPTLAHAE